MIEHKMKFYERYIKRLIDVVCSAAALILLSPVLLITAILVRIKLGSPVIFTQDRPGLHGKVFKLYKFRTMTDQKDENGNLLPDHIRLTSFGRKLRATSLDELPELFNILKGDMSLKRRITNKQSGLFGRFFLYYCIYREIFLKN